MRERLRELLQQLHLHGMAEALDRELERAEKQATAPEEVLYRLALEEARIRQETRLTNRLKQARIPWDWTLESFPFAQQPGVNKTQIMGLAGMDFVRRAENLVFIGAPGTGKSGLACSLLRQACFDGYRGRFYDAQALLDELYASLADRSTPQLLKRLGNYDVLLIDEIGYLTLRPEQVKALTPRGSADLLGRNPLDRFHDRAQTRSAFTQTFAQVGRQITRKRRNRGKHGCNRAAESRDLRDAGNRNLVQNSFGTGCLSFPSVSRPSIHFTSFSLRCSIEISSSPFCMFQSKVEDGRAT